MNELMNDNRSGSPKTLAVPPLFTPAFQFWLIKRFRWYKSGVKQRRIIGQKGDKHILKLKSGTTGLAGPNTSFYAPDIGCLTTGLCWLVSVVLALIGNAKGSYILLRGCNSLYIRPCLIEIALWRYNSLTLDILLMRKETLTISRSIDIPWVREEILSFQPFHHFINKSFCPSINTSHYSFSFYQHITLSFNQ